MQSNLEKLGQRNYYLNTSANEAYRSYLLAYGSHADKDVFDVNQLDLPSVALSFGLTVPPRVDLNFGHKGRKGRKRARDAQGDKQKRQKGSGHAFSADNPYGKKPRGDRRQFSR